jgi:hypothetical protein
MPVGGLDWIGLDLAGQYAVITGLGWVMMMIVEPPVRRASAGTAVATKSIAAHASNQGRWKIDVSTRALKLHTHTFVNMIQFENRSIPRNEK